MISRLQDKLSISSQKRKPIIHIDSAPQLKGLHRLGEIYEHIMSRHTLNISYQPFNEDEPTEQTYFRIYSKSLGIDGFYLRQERRRI